MNMSTRRPLRSRAWIAAASLLALLAGGALTTLYVAQSPVATIGGHEVTDDEYATYADLQRAADPTAEWTRADVLLTIARDQALLDLAREAGLDDVPTTPADLLAEREQVNEQNQAAREQGQVVYGAGDYDVASFHSRSIAQLRAATIRALVGDPRLAVTDQDVAAEFAADPTRWSAAVATYHFDTFTVPGTVGAEPGDVVLARAASAGIDPTTAAVLLPQAAVGTVDVSGADVRSSGLGPDAEAAIPSLGPGQYLEPQPQQGSWVLYRLTSADRDEAEALSTYTPQIRQLLLERRFDDLVESTARRLLGDQN